ncbi:hypothetical protein D5S18_28525 [Nocardia panacis]|uniref:DAGKc domain-containing protein n=1 Tax=Nocardia panacis TaxID=2340916 RepID=A0A3A4K909_9NOCA|nr:diacylglycerol kinase family protein [Nocardia panacis]RJO69844.1 hypothetical protein D5S18_28525 [Nocardia panacis]
MNQVSPRRLTVVTNPLSGLGKGEQAAVPALARFAARGAVVTEIRADSAAASVRLLRESIERTRPDAVVCVGGDGLIAVLLPALAETGIPLGMVPAGTGNDLARELGVPTDDPAAAADLVLDGRIRVIDLGRIEAGGPRTEPMWFATVTGTGLDARVTLRANAMHWPRGRLRYTVAALAELSGGLTVPYRIELAGVTAEGLANPGASADTVVTTEAIMVAVGNARTYGGGMRICPDALLDDGLLDLTVVGALSRLEMLRLLPALAAGKRLDHPRVEQYRAASITLSAPGAPATADGEPAGMLPLTIRVAPGALSVLTP